MRHGSRTPGNASRMIGINLRTGRNTLQVMRFNLRLTGKLVANDASGNAGGAAWLADGAARHADDASAFAEGRVEIAVGAMG